jgi:DNA (cytosine-5)-methyltransferase 1
VRKAQLPRAAEFFAGIGLVHLGLQGHFDVTWGNDYDQSKREMYAGQFASPILDGRDIAEVTEQDIPDVSLAWASFPCTDLSLAGNRDGLAGQQSGTFWNFIDIVRQMKDQGRQPPVVVLENVVGLASSRKGDDIAAAVRSLNDLGYSVDVLSIDGARFVPQSRPRLFFVAALSLPKPMRSVDSARHPLRPDWLDSLAKYEDVQGGLNLHYAKLPQPPMMKSSGLSGCVEDLEAHDEEWWSGGRLSKFLSELSPTQLLRLEGLKQSATVQFRTAYRRTRNGVPQWEIRDEEIAGCLRTARGGSSKQAVVRVHRSKVQVRWMTAREYANLMGAPEYNLDGLRKNQALSGFGDAVVVPVVAWLAEHYLSKIVPKARKTGPSVTPIGQLPLDLENVRIFAA